MKWWNRLFRAMWQMNSTIKDVESIAKGTYGKRVVNKVKFRIFNKFFR